MRNKRREALCAGSVKSSVGTWVRALPGARDDDRTMGIVRTASGRFVPAIVSTRPMLHEQCASDGSEELFKGGVRSDGSAPRRETALEKFAALRAALTGV